MTCLDHMIRPTNKFHVMRCILCEGPINRSAIAGKVHLSIPAVMTITNDLIERGLIKVAGIARGGTGKQPEMLDVVADCEYRVGVDIGRGTVRLVIVDLQDRVIFHTLRDAGKVEDEREFVDRLSQWILDSINESQVDQERIVGVGVAMPGLIEKYTGHVVFSPDFGWSDVSLQVWLSSSLPFPVIVENANRALALSEAEWGRHLHEEREQIFLCVNIGHGIGSAFLQNEQLYYGSSGTSGEIGHITVCKDGAICVCGNTGCLEAMASGDAIGRQARDTLYRGIPSKISEMAHETHGKVDAKMVFDAAAQGDEVALSIVDKATDYIGIGLATVVNIIDPERIVLCGGLTKNGALFFERVKASMRRRQMKDSGRNVLLSISKKGEYSTAMGATKVIDYNGWRVPALKHFY